jgi:ABC-type transport system involved in multi-copper enzyme maturation permease subunit
MLLRIAAWEIGQQLRSHVFWIVFAVSALMVTGALANDQLRVGIAAERGAALVVRTHLIWSLFYMFTAAAFVADAVLRDDLTGFAPIVRAAPVRRVDYLLGRFLGAYAATCICFLSVPAALLVSPFLPWTDPALGVAPDASTLLFALLALALPNLLISAAAFFGLATATRSMGGTLIGAVFLLMLYGAGQEGQGTAFALLEPFGFSASADGRVLLANRLLWLAIIAALIALAARDVRARAPRIRPALPEQAPPPAADPLPEPRFGAATLWSQAAARTRFELRATLRNPVFAILLALGLARAGQALWLALPAADPIPVLIEAFLLVPTVIALFFAGELYWNEREHRVHNLIGSSPLPAAALLLPKLLALCLIFVGLAAVSALAALIVPALKGTAVPAVTTILAGYVLPKSFDWILVGILAFFLQALAPNKLAGWGLFVLYLIASLALEFTGHTNPLYRYGETPAYPLVGEGGSIYRLYWASFALLLVTLTLALAGPDPLPARLRAAARRMKGLLGISVALFAATSLALLACLLTTLRT